LFALKLRDSLKSETDAKRTAEKALESETDAKRTAEKALERETVAKLAETKAKETAEKALERETAAKLAETKAKETAEKALESEKDALMFAKYNAGVARYAEKDALDAQQEAVLSRDLARRKAAQVQIGNSVASQSLAKFQLDQSNVQEATRQLTSAMSLSEDGFADGKVPNLETWASRRLKLLSNQDLSRQQIPAVSTLAVSTDGSSAVVGTRDGKVRWLSINDRNLQLNDSSFDLEKGSISTAAISPKGDEAVFAVREGTKSGLYAWKATEPQPKQIGFTGSEEFERIAYSPDGLRIAAGISKGLSVWNAKEGWAASPSGQAVLEVRLPSIRGELIDLQWIDSESLLAHVRFNNRPILHRIDLQQAKLSSDATKIVTQLALPTPLDQQISAVATVGSGALWIFGSEDGSLHTGQLLPSASADTAGRIGNIFALPHRHRTAIKDLATSMDGRVISVGAGEPSVHLWKSDPTGQIAYEGPLYGVAGEAMSADQNLGIAQFVAGDVAMGVDNRGEVFLWDILSQKRRQRLDRGTSESSSLYPSPVVALHELQDGRRVVAVCEDGMTDLWNLVDGRSVPLDSGERWSYFGHSPGSQLVDMAVDPQAGVVVTAALMGQVPAPYNPKQHTQEFVVWDRATGNMRSRWSEASQTVPRITLLDGGSKLLVSAEGKTRVVRLDGGDEAPWSSSQLESYFAVAHPTVGDRFAMVQKLGKVFLWDRSKGFPVRVGPNESDELADAVQGGWSLDGNFFFLVDSNGYLSKYQAEIGEGGMKLVMQRPLSKLIPKTDSEQPVRLNPSSARDVDMSIDRTTGDIHLVIRSSGRGSLYAIIPPDLTSVKKIEFPKDLAWLSENDAGTPILVDRIHPKFAMQKQSRDPIAIRKQIGKLVYVATQSGRVMEMESDSTSISTYGRRKVIDIAGDRQSDSLLVLLSGGLVWKLSVDTQSQGTWSKLAYELPGATAIELSPDGKELAVFDQTKKNLRLVDPATGNMQREWTEIGAFAWDPKTGSDLAVLQASGAASIFAQGKETKLAIQDDLTGSSIESLHFFRERFQDPNTPPKTYLMVQSEREGKGRLSFLPAADQPEEGQDQDKLYRVEEFPAGLLIEPANDESVVAIGDRTGTLSVEYIAPSFETRARIFDLEGHLGGSIRTLKFTRDGRTLMSSDAQRRLYGWLSSEVEATQ
jgi:WD40 repeat protein